MAIVDSILTRLLPTSLRLRYLGSRVRASARAWSDAADVPACTCGAKAWGPTGDTQIVGGQRLRRQFGVTDVETMEIEQVSCTNCGASATLGRPIGAVEDSMSAWRFL